MRVFSVLAVALVVAVSFATGERREAVELGTVKWERDFEEAMRVAKKSGKPVLILFQEVPG